MEEVNEIKILEGQEQLSWDYDGEADVLYISIGQPRPAIGIDAGEGTIILYDEAEKEVVGITFIGLRARLLQGLSAK